VGFTSFNLMVAHIALVTLGYSGSVTGFPKMLWNLIVDYPGMLLALAGTLMLVLVVVTSIRKARKRLRYESWHLLHLYAYLGVGLALPHQMWTGTDFIGSPVATAYWWSLWGAAALSVIWFRLAVPLIMSSRHRLEVTRVTNEAPGVVSVQMRGVKLDQLPIRAGQFMFWRFLSGPGWSRAHPYSLSAAPDGRSLRITVKNLGDDSGKTGNLRPGTRVLFEGPYGRLTGETYRGGPVTMLACGVGVTPLRALLEELPYQPGQATLVYRSHAQRDIIFRDELTDLARRRGVRVVHVLGKRADRPSWLPQNAAHLADGKALLDIVPNLAQNQIYICGPTPWMHAAQAAVLDCGVAKANIHSEEFSW
jgi:predicted ferric reductase